MEQTNETAVEQSEDASVTELPTATNAPDEQDEKSKLRRPLNRFFIGYWHYGVILTYLSLALSVCGICFAAATSGPRRDDICALFCLLAGLCDAFDGMVAKTRKNRTEGDKMFGMNIDTLNDIVSFGVAPVMVGVAMGMTRWYYTIVYIIFVLCGLVRLAYFQVDEVERLKNPDAGRRESYTGMPITNISLAVPVFYLVATMFDNGLCGFTPHQIWIYRSVIMMSMYLVGAFLFVFRFKFFKAHLKALIITSVTIVVLVVSLALIRYYVGGVPIFEPLTTFDGFNEFAL